MRMKITGNNVNLDNINNVIFDAKYEILCDILSRLPAKSLMRFKTVCKGWRLIIQEDSYLINLHLTRLENKKNLSTTSLLIYPVHNCSPVGCSERKMTFFSAEQTLSSSSSGGIALSACQHRSCNGISVPYTNHFGSMLKPINGLVCFTNTYYGSVLIYNPSTGEKTSWIPTTTGEYLVDDEFQKQNIDDYSCDFGFGFDPTTKTHKVVCVYSVTRASIQDNFVEVLTVGSNTWKRTNDVLDFTVNGEPSVYVNGYIYWNCPPQDILDGSAFIMGFDVNSEKFNRVIEIPYFIFDSMHGRNTKSVIQLVEVDGHLALLDKEEDHSINLWIYNDKKQQGIMTPPKSHNNDSSDYDDGGGSWSKEIIPMPYRDAKSYLGFEPISGTDLIVLKPFGQPVELDRLYYYDRKDKVYGEKKVDIITKTCSDHLSPDLGYDITTFSGSLLKVSD